MGEPEISWETFTNQRANTKLLQLIINSQNNIKKKKMQQGIWDSMSLIVQIRVLYITHKLVQVRSTSTCKDLYRSRAIAGSAME